MPLELIAIDVEDGWGVVKDKGSFYSMRPPYEKKEYINRLDSFLIHCNMELLDKKLVFNSYKKIEDYLKQKYLEDKKQRGIKLPSQSKLLKLLEYANSEIIDGYLNQIDKDVISTKNYNGAERILKGVLKYYKNYYNEDKKDYEEIIARTKKTLAKVQRMKREDYKKELKDFWEKTKDIKPRSYYGHPKRKI